MGRQNCIPPGTPNTDRNLVLMTEENEKIIPPSRFTVAAVGDSITTGFNAEKLGDNAAHSWATGNFQTSTAASHRDRLVRFFPSLDIQVVNAAVAGSRASALASQITRVSASNPDYVTILMGANDLVQWLQGEYGALLEAFARDVRSAVERLIAVNPRVMILLVGIPNQSRVLDHWLNSNGLRLPPVLIDRLRVAYRERWERTNRALESIAQAHSSNVRFAGKVGHFQFEGKHLSSHDRYHPSVEGQRLLAQITWDEGFFPG